ncbi:MAG: circadian clock KaiB family protein [Candidatus Anammoxibacter sp.]
MPNRTLLNAYRNYNDEIKQDSKTQHYERHFFKLYLAGYASKFCKIIKGLRNILDNNLNCYDLDVINLMKNPELAERDSIIATPTVVNGNSSEPPMVIGDMSNSETVLPGLNLIKKADLNEVKTVSSLNQPENH